MHRNAPFTAFCSALPFSALGGSDGTDVPEWVQLLPAGEITTVDGRGPFHVVSLQAIADASLKAGQKLAIDECHSTDLAAPLGLAAPARGWIVELQARTDGLWGRVEWTGEGLKLMADKAYRGISPAVVHTKDKTVIGILRASLTNNPNLQGMVSLHSENIPEINTMDWKAKLLELLGLGSTADDAAIEAALMAKMGSGETALCAADVLQLPQFVALQSQLTDITGKYNALIENGERAAATAFVDGAIAEGRVGLKPVRGEYIALHMQNPELAAKLIGGMPALKGPSPSVPAKPAAAGGDLAAEDRLVMSLFGVDETEYRQALGLGGVTKETL